MIAIALAAGFFFPDIGATSLGRGATGAAGAGDLSAVAFNPAGLVALDGLRVQIEASSTWQPIDFTRAGNCAGRACPTVSQSSGAFLNTLSGVSYSIRPGLVAALAIYGPPSHGRENFPDPRDPHDGSSAAYAPQRYSLISENNLVVYPGISLAWRALEWLDVGATLQVRYFRAQQTQALYTLGGVGGEITDLDAVAAIDVTDSARLAWGAGAIVRPMDGLSIGLSARPGIAVHAQGTIDVQLSPVAAAAGANTTGRDARVELQLPPEARLGARFERSALALFGDVVWENWGVMRRITLTPTDVVIHQGGSDLTVGPITIPRNWHAAWSFRAGGEYKLLDWLTLRAGGLYETSAIPEETQQLDFVSLARAAATLGASARYKGLNATLGYAHFFPQSRTVTTSQVVRIDPYPAPDFVIGNGQYDTSLDAVALQLAWTL